MKKGLGVVSAKKYVYFFEMIIIAMHKNKKGAQLKTRIKAEKHF